MKRIIYTCTTESLIYAIVGTKLNISHVGGTVIDLRSNQVKKN